MKKKHILYFICYVIFIFVLMEIIFRLFPISDRIIRGIAYRRDFEESIQIDPEWGWCFMPNIDTFWDCADREKGKVIIRFKTMAIPNYPKIGMRESSLNKKNDKIIPVLGDSFTYGPAVNSEEIWLEKIQSRNPGIEMLNLGMGGGITKALTEYRTLRDRLPEHNVVIYALWIGNEFLDNYVFPLGQKEKFRKQALSHSFDLFKWRLYSYIPSFYIFERIAQLVKIKVFKIRSPSYVPEDSTIFNEQLGEFIVNPRNQMGVRYLEEEYSDIIKEGVENTEKAISDFKKLAENRRFVIIIIPFKEQLYREVTDRYKKGLDYHKPNEIIKDICQRYDVKCVDISTSLEKYKKYKLFWDYDPHFTAAGHYYASIEIENALKKIGVIK